MNVERTLPPFGGHDGQGPRVLLRRLREIMAQGGGAQHRLDRLTAAIASNMVADVCSIYLRRPDDDLELVSTIGLNPEAVYKTRMKRGEGLVGVVAATAKPLSTADAPNHPAFSYRPETGEDPLHSFLGVPLIRAGRVLGVLVAQNKTIRRYTEEEVEAAQTVAMVLAEVAASGELLDEAATEDVEIVLHKPVKVRGVGFVPGVVIGVAAFHEPPARRHKVFAENVGHEAERLEQGLDALRKSVDDMLASNKRLSGVSREVLEAYRLFAYDRGWKDRLRDAVFSGLSAEAAVDRVMSENRVRMTQARDPYLRERLMDLDDLSHRLMRFLDGDGAAGPRDLPEDAILFARAMGPAELLEYAHARLRGLVLGEGSATSHVAIVARALEVPLIGRAGSALERAEEGDQIVIDGGSGEVHIRPTDDVVKSFRSKQELQSERQAEYAALKGAPARTRDGVEVSLLMNAGLTVDLPHIEETGAEGVGLFRTELQFLIGARLPQVPAQTELYREVYKLAGAAPVTFRIADLGGDKAAPYMERRREANPAMGWRGLRMSLDRPGLFRGQVRALIAAAEGRPLDILAPLVTVPEEIDQARALLEKELARVKRAGRPLPTAVRLGAMIETPSSAFRVGEIAARADFLSVGGNDLAQFWFACDREAQHLSGRFDPIDPGFLALLKSVVDTAAAAGKPLTYCGEQAADPVVALALIGLGVRRLSLPATAVGPVRKLVRSVNAGTLTDWAASALAVAAPDLRASLIEAARADGAAL